MHVKWNLALNFGEVLVLFGVEFLVEQRGVAVAVKFYLCYGTSWIMIDTNQINWFFIVRRQQLPA